MWFSGPTSNVFLLGQWFEEGHYFVHLGLVSWTLHLIGKLPNTSYVPRRVWPPNVCFGVIWGAGGADLQQACNFGKCAKLLLLESPQPVFFPRPEVLCTKVHSYYHFPCLFWCAISRSFHFGEKIWLCFLKVAEPLQLEFSGKLVIYSVSSKLD